jgi:translation initiation factor 1 (eIF-1/SUI1)
MDITTLNTGSKIASINNKVEIRNLKVKQHLRTFIIGLDNFMSTDEIDTFIVFLKKKLGAGVEKKVTETGVEYGFQGDHKDKIKELLIETKKINNSQIKM